MAAKLDLPRAITWPSAASTSSSWRRRRVWAKVGGDGGTRFACSPQRATTACLGGQLFWFVANHVLNVGNPLGRKARKSMLSRGGLLINLTRQDVIRAGVELTPRVASVLGGRPQLDDGRRLDVTNVVWCTGFGHDFSWIRLPVLDADGMPSHKRGVVASEPGLYFVGLPFLTRFASALVGGVGQDASAIVEHAAHTLSPPRTSVSGFAALEAQHKGGRLPQISGT